METNAILCTSFRFIRGRKNASNSQLFNAPRCRKEKKLAKLGLFFGQKTFKKAKIFKNFWHFLEIFLHFLGFPKVLRSKNILEF